MCMTAPPPHTRMHIRVCSNDTASNHGNVSRNDNDEDDTLHAPASTECNNTNRSDNTVIAAHTAAVCTRVTRLSPAALGDGGCDVYCRTAAAADDEDDNNNSHSHSHHHHLHTHHQRRCGNNSSNSNSASVDDMACSEYSNANSMLALDEDTTSSNSVDAGHAAVMAGAVGESASAAAARHKTSTTTAATSAAAATVVTRTPVVMMRGSHNTDEHDTNAAAATTTTTTGTTSTPSTHTTQQQQQQQHNMQPVSANDTAYSATVDAVAAHTDSWPSYMPQQQQQQQEQQQQQQQQQQQYYHSHYTTSATYAAPAAATSSSSASSSASREAPLPAYNSHLLHNHDGVHYADDYTSYYSSMNNNSNVAMDGYATHAFAQYRQNVAMATALQRQHRQQHHQLPLVSPRTFSALSCTQRSVDTSWGRRIFSKSNSNSNNDNTSTSVLIAAALGLSASCNGGGAGGACVACDDGGAVYEGYVPQNYCVIDTLTGLDTMCNRLLWLAATAATNQAAAVASATTTTTAATAATATTNTTTTSTASSYAASQPPPPQQQQQQQQQHMYDGHGMDSHHYYATQQHTPHVDGDVSYTNNNNNNNNNNSTMRGGCGSEDDAAATAAAAVAAAQSGVIIALDLEGRDLGRHGSVCIITLATPQCVYVIDVVQLGGAAALRVGGPLRRVLECASITKLMFDCRADGDALFYLYGVRLRGVCDLQVASCLVDFPRCTYLPSMKTVFASLGLMQAGDVAVKHAGRALFDARSGGDFDAWERRPLAPLLLRYCVVDVKYFFVARLQLLAYMDAAYTIAERRLRDVCNGVFDPSARNAMRDF